MSFHSGTVNSATPATSLLGTLDTIIQAHAAWEFVEEVVGTQTARVYRCLGTLNATPSDFFVAIVRANDGTGPLLFTLFEDWDATGKLAVRYAVAPSGTASVGSLRTPVLVSGTTTYSIGATGQTLFTTTEVRQISAGPLAINSAVPYWFSITNERLVLATTAGTGTGGVYAGTYEPFHETSPQPMPIVLTGLNILATQSVLTTGTPTATGSYTRARTAAAARQNWLTAAAWWGRPNYAAGTSARETLTNLWVPLRVILGEHNGAAATQNMMHGFLRDAVYIAADNTMAVAGDTLTSDGVTYRCMGVAASISPAGALFVSEAA